jgi:F-type H+-transporting ATPase subunit delta
MRGGLFVFLRKIANCGNLHTDAGCQSLSPVLPKRRGWGFRSVPYPLFCFGRDILTATDQAISGVPGRYAAALFELVDEAKSIDVVAAHLTTFQTMLKSSEDLQRMVRSPVFSGEDQMAALEALCAKAAISGLALNFIKLVAKNRRLPALSDAITAFNALVAQSKGEVSAEVTSAEKLSDKHVKDLKTALKTAIGRDVQLSAVVDKSILGGLIVKVGSKMMDNSLKTKLQNLKVAMKGTG